MIATNETLREALRAIEAKAATALANQPHDELEAQRELDKALADIIRVAHVTWYGTRIARWGVRKRI